MRAMKGQQITDLAAKVVDRSLAIVQAALGESKPEDIRADAMLPEKDVPFYLKMAAKMATAATLAAGGEGGPAHNLNILIVQQSESREAWVKDVQDFKKADAQPAKKTIDAKVVE